MQIKADIDAIHRNFTRIFFYFPTGDINISQKVPLQALIYNSCFFSEFKKAVKLVVETVHFDKSNVVQVPVFNFRLFLLLVLTAVLWRSESEFLFCCRSRTRSGPDPKFYTCWKIGKFFDFYSQYR
jgi:hypothetical protein